jgi:uncharacterized phage-associated protein
MTWGRRADDVTSAFDVAAYFLAKQDPDAGEIISNLKLQKLLYYAQGFHLAMFDAPLFPERIKAWEHGPVVPQVWKQYTGSGGSSLPVPDEKMDIDPETASFLDEVYDVYGQFSAWRLRELSHDEPPWIEAFNGTGVVHNDAMRSFFKTRLVTD